MAPNYQQLIQEYVNNPDPRAKMAALAELQKIDAASGGLAGGPMAGPPPGAPPSPGDPAAFVQAVQGGQYGTADDPLVMDPVRGDRLLPMSMVKRQNDTMVAPPPPGPNPMAGMAAGPAAPQMMRASSGGGSKQVSAPEFPPHLLPAKQALAEQAIGNAQGAAEQKAGLLGQHEQTVQLWADQANLEAREAGGAAKETMQRWEAAGRELDAGRRQLAKSKVDPGRLWSQMGTARKALSVIAVAIGGYVEGFTQGKVQNKALQMLNMAIDRDIEAQRDAFKARLEELNLGERQRAVMWQQWTAQESQRKAAALRLSQLEIAKQGLQTERADVRQKAEDMVLGIRDNLISLEAKTVPKVTKSSNWSSRMVPVGADGAQGKPPPDAVQGKLKQSVGLLQKLDQLQRDLPQYSRAGRYLPNSDAAAFVKDAKLLGKLFIKSEVGEALSGGEAEAAEGQLISRWSSPAALARDIGRMREKIKATALRELQTASAYSNVAPFAQQLQPYFQGAGAGAQQQFGRQQ